MTPYGFAKQECCSMDSDGTCMMIEPSSLHDYSLPLPTGMSQERWQRLVDEARAESGEVIRADTRLWKQLDETQDHANRHRLDLYYCLDCGRRMAHPGDICRVCRGLPVIPDDVDRRCKVALSKRCGHFEKAILPLAGDPPPNDEPGLQKRRAQARQTYRRVQNLEAADEPGRTCPDCGDPMPKGRRYCPRCVRRRRSASYRAARNSCWGKRARKPLSVKA